jgi:hypothetical protein
MPSTTEPLDEPLINAQAMKTRTKLTRKVTAIPPSNAIASVRKNE